MSSVRLFVYDISRGMLPPGLSNMLGFELDLIPHTGVEVFGNEYFYGGGIQKEAHRNVVQAYGMEPKKTEVLGRTSKTILDLHNFLGTIDSRFSPSSYNILSNNCNHFSECVVRFLLGDAMGIPEEILRLPERIMSTPIGQMLAPMWQQMESSMTGNLVAFNAPVQGVPPSSWRTSPAASSVESAPVSIRYLTPGNVEGRIDGVNPTWTVGQFRNAVLMAASQSSQNSVVTFKDRVLSSGDVSQISTIPGLMTAPEGVVIISSSTSAPASSTASTPKTLVQALQNLDELEKDPYKAGVALETICLILDNVLAFPHEAKYRSVKKSSKRFVRTLGPYGPAGVELMTALGFCESAPGSDDLTLTATPENWKKFQIASKIVQATRRKRLLEHFNTFQARSLDELWGKVCNLYGANDAVAAAAARSLFE